MTIPMKQGVLDEAGDVGRAPGSSRYLIVAVVIGDLHRLRKVVAKARKRLSKRLKNIPELKAKITPPRVVARLLNDIAALNVEIVTVILDFTTRHNDSRADREDSCPDQVLPTRAICGILMPSH